MHYLTSGLSGLRCVEQCLEAAGLETSGVRSILDFPCGYGRVLRFLKIRFPDAYIAGCEIDPEALDFCRRSFSVPGLRSKIPISQLELDRKFDLIWCGSLLTHIDEEAALEVLRFFHEHLQPRGVCVFTTHGRKVAGWMENRTHKFMLDGNGLDTVVTGYKRAGYGYAPYPFRDDYGVSAASRDRMAALAAAAGDWREVAFLDAGWDNCQDVHAYQNAVDS